MYIPEIKSDEIFDALILRNCYTFVVYTMSDQLSFIYVYDGLIRSKFIIGYNHPDLLNSGKYEWVDKLRIESIYYDTSDVMSSFNIYSYIMTGEMTNVKTHTRELLLSRYIRNEATDIFAIPIVKWIELFDRMISDASHLEMVADDIFAYNAYINIVRPAIKYLNTQPITVDQEIFSRITGTDTDHITSRYKPFTSTGRPTNVSGINLLSMPKNSEIRESIINTYKGGSLVEYDYKSFHITLLANYLGIDFGQDDVYDALGTLYGDAVTRTASKRLSIKYLYSDNDDDRSPDHPLFNKVHTLRNSLHEQYMTDGYIRSPLFKRRIYLSDNKVVTPGKLLAYFMQSYESEINFTTICEISEYLLLRKSRLILYTYDSFLFDYHPDDGKGILSEMRNIFERVQCSVAISVGLDYKDMFKIELE